MKAYVKASKVHEFLTVLYFTAFLRIWQISQRETSFNQFTYFREIEYPIRMQEWLSRKPTQDHMWTWVGFLGVILKFWLVDRPHESMRINYNGGRQLLLPKQALHLGWKHLRKRNFSCTVIVVLVLIVLYAGVPVMGYRVRSSSPAWAKLFSRSAICSM